MEEKDNFERIRFEEKIRFDIQKKMADQVIETKNTFWKFLNSNFGLFIFSSIFLGLITWGYNEWQSNSKIDIERKQLVNKLSTEIQYRTFLLEFKLEHAKTSVDSTRWAVVYDIEDIFKGQTERLTRNGKSQTQFTPIFSEYANRGIPSLFWEYLFATKNEKSLSEKETLASLLRFGFLLDTSIAKDLDSDFGFPISNIDSLQKSIKFLKNLRMFQL
jgi:hypothetical protein